MTFSLKKGSMDVHESVGRDAVAKIRGLVQSANICMVTNNILEWPLQNESLNNQWLDEQGNIWFLCFKSEDNDQAYATGCMEVFYSNAARSEFLSLVGVASVSTQADIVNQPGIPFQFDVTTSKVKTPFRLLKFTPSEAFCWDDIVKDMVAINLFSEKDSPYQDKLCA